MCHIQCICLVISPFYVLLLCLSFIHFILQSVVTLASIRTVMPDFSQVYSFIGSVFDPNATDHLRRLKEMDPINLETVCQLYFSLHSLLLLLIIV